MEGVLQAYASLCKDFQGFVNLCKDFFIFSKKLYMRNYEIPEWMQKREYIISRDNYTCQNQNCKTFNPSLGRVEMINPSDGSFEFHEYKNNYESEYIISSSRSGLTVNINFGSGLWINMPVLQVHHKRYIESRKFWDYDDEDLITLCKDCHRNYHVNNQIYRYDISGTNIIRKELTEVKDFGSGKDHDFKPWIFINKNNNEYSLSETICPTLSYFLFEKEFERKESIKIEAEKMVQDFFKVYLPDYSINYK